MVSVASLWEVTIKAQKCLLPISQPALWLDAGIRSIDATIVPVRAAYVYALNRMPPIHRIHSTVC